MARYKVVLILTSLFIIFGAAFASDTSVRQIEIKSAWGGLGKAGGPPFGRFTIALPEMWVPHPTWFSLGGQAKY